MLPLEREDTHRSTYATGYELQRRNDEFNHSEAFSNLELPSTPLWHPADETPALRVQYAEGSASPQFDDQNIIARRRPDPDSEGIDVSGRTLLEIGQAAQAFVRSQRRLARSRQKALLHRDSAAYKWTGYKHTLKFIQKSNQSFVDASAEFVKQEKPHGDVSSLSELSQQVAHDDIAFATKVDDLLETQRELSGVEFYMQEQEESLHAAAATMLKVLERIGLVTPEEVEDFAESRSTTRYSQSLHPPSPDLHPLLEVYFDKAGDVNVFTDRLRELQADHAHARTARLLQQEQEKVFDQSDENFEAGLRQREVESIAIIDNAVKQRDAARIDCLAIGLDPDEYNKPFPEQHFALSIPDENQDVVSQESPTSIARPSYRFAESLAIPTFPFGPRNESFTITSTETGPMLTDATSLRKNSREQRTAAERVQDWLANNEGQVSETTSEVDTERICASSRPTIRRSATNSVPDLRHADIDASEVQNLIAEFSSHQAQLTQSYSEPVLSPSWPISSPTLRPRSKSASDVDGSVQRHDSLQSVSIRKPP